MGERPARIAIAGVALRAGAIVLSARAGGSKRARTRGPACRSRSPPASPSGSSSCAWSARARRRACGAGARGSCPCRSSRSRPGSRARAPAAARLVVSHRLAAARSTCSPTSSNCSRSGRDLSASVATLTSLYPAGTISWRGSSCASVFVSSSRPASRAQFSRSCWIVSGDARPDLRPDSRRGPRLRADGESSSASRAFVMKALARLPPPQGIAAMQSINVTVTIFVLAVFLGTAVACLALAVSALLGGTPPRRLFLLGSRSLTSRRLVVTWRSNVPRTDALAAVDPASPKAPGLWRNYLTGGPREPCPHRGVPRCGGVAHDCASADGS